MAEDNSLVGCRVQSAMLSGLTLILIAVTGWMKLVSYAHTNSDVRALIKAGEKVRLEICLLVSYLGEGIFWRELLHCIRKSKLFKLCWG